MSKITVEMVSGSPPPDREIREVISALVQLGSGAYELVEYVGIYCKEGPSGDRCFELKVVLKLPCPRTGKDEFKGVFLPNWEDGLIARMIVGMVDHAVRDRMRELASYRSALEGFLLATW